MTDDPAPAAWRATVGRWIGRVLFRVLYSCKVFGANHVPREGPVLLAPNHTGYLDGALVFAMAPRPSHFLVLDKTFDGWLDRLLHFVGMIPIDQTRGDRRALGQSLQVLRRGGAVGIFPEGGRGRGDLAAAGKGTAWLALQGDCEVVPVACLGTRRTGELAAWWPPLRSRLVVDFGPPIRLTQPAGIPGRARLEAATEQLRVALAAHVTAAAELHGIPLPTDVPSDVVE